MKKFGLLCLALVLALGSLGVGFALWSETLYIDGVVYTGEVDAEWTFCGCFDIESKDVGTISAQIDPVDPHILHITVNNGYPCYFGDCEVEFTNVGTIPVIIQSITIIPDNFTLASANGANNGQLWIELVDGVGLQLEPYPDEPYHTAQSFKVHVEQCAEQNATYTFSIEIVVVQYNEYEPPV